MASPRGQQFSRELDHARQEPPPAPLKRSPAAGAFARSQEPLGRAVAKRPDRNAPLPPERSPSGPASAARSAPRASDADAPAEKESSDASRQSEEEPEQKAVRRDTDPSQAIIPDAAAVRGVAPPTPLTPAQAVGPLPRDEQILSAPEGTVSLAQAFAAGAQPGGTLQAQLGRAAYRLSPHAVNEPVPSVPQGRAPDEAAKSLQPADPEQQAGLVELHVVNVQEMVQLSNEARAAQVAHPDADLRTAGTPGEASHTAVPADSNSAQARNQLLAQFGGPASSVPGVALPANAGLEQKAGGSPGTMGRELTPAKAGKRASSDALGDGPAPILPTGAAAVGTVHQANDAVPPNDADPKAGPALLDKIVQESRWLIRSGHNEVTLRLQPEHLGDMKLKVVHKDGNMSVQMTVDTSAAKHLLDASMNDLRQRLQSENLAQGNLLLNVDVRQGADSGGFNGFARGAGQESGVTAIPAGRSEEAAAPTRTQPRARGDSNISIYA